MVGPLDRKKDRPGPVLVREGVLVPEKANVTLSGFKKKKPGLHAPLPYSGEVCLFLENPVKSNP
jgi:hypothetical protein